jgi:hypothetical protein
MELPVSYQGDTRQGYHPILVACTQIGLNPPYSHRLLKCALAFWNASQTVDYRWKHDFKRQWANQDCLGRMYDMYAAIYYITYERDHNGETSAAS